MLADCVCHILRLRGENGLKFFTVLGRVLVFLDFYLTVCWLVNELSAQSQEAFFHFYIVERHYLGAHYEMVYLCHC